MKRNDALFLLVPLGLAAAAWSQTAIDLRTQTKDVDFSGAVSTKPFKTGTSLPGTCTTGAAFLNLAATAGQNLYLCTATNSWTQVQEGNPPTWGSGSRPVAANALGTSGDCAAWSSVGLIDAGAPCGSGSGSGSGAGMFQQLGDFALTYSGASGTVGASCSVATPCIAAVGYGAYSFTSPATVTASGSGADTFYVYVNSGGTRVVGYGGSAAPVCSGCTVMAGVTSYPAGAATIGRFTVSGGAIVASVSDRAVVSGPPTLVAGSNVTISTAGNVVTIGSTGGSGSGSLPSTVVETNQSNTYTTGTQDFRQATHTLPVVTGLAAGKPGTCTVGEQYFATDAAAGQNLYLCTSTNTWNQAATGSGGGGGCSITTAGQGYYFPFGTSGVPVNQNAYGGNYGGPGPVPRISQFVLPCSMTISKIVFNVDGASGTSCSGGTCGLVWGIYTASGSLVASTTPIVSGGTPDLNTLGTMTAVFSPPVSLTAGTAYYIGEANDGSALSLTGYNTSAGYYPQLLMNANAVRAGWGSVAWTGDGASISLPSSLGTPSASSAGKGTPPFVMFER